MVSKRRRCNMPVSSVEYQSLLARVKALENKMNDVITALGRTITIDQITQLGLLKQTDVEQLKTRMDGVESRATQLESYHQS